MKRMLTAGLIFITNMSPAQPSSDVWKGTYVNKETGLSLTVKDPVKGLYEGAFIFKGDVLPIQAAVMLGVFSGQYLYQGRQYPFSLARNRGEIFLTADGVTVKVEKSSTTSSLRSPAASTGSADRNTVSPGNSAGSGSGTKNQSWTRRLSGKQLLFLETLNGGTTKITIDLFANGQFRYTSSSSYSSGGYSDFSYAGQDADHGTWSIIDQRGSTFLVTKSNKSGETLNINMRPGTSNMQVLLGGKRFFIQDLQ